MEVEASTPEMSTALLEAPVGSSPVQPAPMAPVVAHSAHHGVNRDSIPLIGASVLVGLGNYGFALVLIWALSARQFSEVSSVFSLLLVVSTVASASLPWVLAKQVAQSPPGSQNRRQAVSFALFTSIGAGVIFSFLVVLLASRYANWEIEAVAGAGTFAIFVWSVGSGYLQGSRRLEALAGFSVAEISMKVGLGLAFVALGFGAVGALGGAAVGVGAVAAFGIWLVRHEISRPKRGNSELWRQMASIGGIQVAVAVITTLDVTTTSVVRGTSVALAGYQAMLVFGRIPLFTSTALSMVAFSRIAAERDDSDAQTRTAAGALSMYLILSTATVAVVATLPVTLLRIVLPATYVSRADLLLPLAIAGVSAGFVNLTTTFFQARGTFRAPLRLLVSTLPLAAVVFALVSGSVLRLAWTAALVEVLLAVAVGAMTASHFVGMGLLRSVTKALLATAVAVTGLRLLDAHVGLWLTSTAVLVAVALLLARPRPQADDLAPDAIRGPNGRTTSLPTIFPERSGVTTAGEGDAPADVGASVIIPTYRRTHDLNRLIEQIAGGTLAPLEIVVVNNDPLDSALITADVPVEVRVLDARLGLNIAGARNRGWRAARGALCLFIDDDNTVAADTLERLVAGAGRDGRYGLVGPVIYRGSDPDVVWCAGTVHSMWSTRTTFPHGGDRLDCDATVLHTESMPDAFLIRRQALEAVAGFDEEAFPFHYEEADIGARLRRAGWETVVVTDARCWHHGNVEQNPAIELSRALRLSGPARLHLMTANRIVFHHRHSQGMRRVVALGAGVPALLLVTLAMLIAEPSTDARTTLRVFAAMVRGALQGYRRCLGREATRTIAASPTSNKGEEDDSA